MASIWQGLDLLEVDVDVSIVPRQGNYSLVFSAFNPRMIDS